MKHKLAAALAAVSLGACSSVSPYISHMSHPDRGWPVDQRPEWALDIVGVEAEKEFGRVVFTSSLGYVVTANEPERFVSSFTLKYKIPLQRGGCTTDTDCMRRFGGDGSPRPLSASER